MPLFYMEKGKKRDAALHEQIIAQGDEAAARQVSRELLKELGINTAMLDDPHAPTST